MSPFFPTMTIGQLKYIGNKVWNRLVDAGYTNAVPSWLALNTNTDNVVANLGQLKTIFNFDLSLMTGVPNPVTDLESYSSTSGEIDLAWVLPTVNTATSIIIQDSTDGGLTWTTVTTLSSTATSYAATS